MRKKMMFMMFVLLVSVPIAVFAASSNGYEGETEADSIGQGSIVEIVAAHLDARGHDSAIILGHIFQQHTDGYTLEEIQEYINQEYSIYFGIEALMELTEVNSQISPRLLLCIISHNWGPWGAWQHLFTDHGRYDVCGMWAACHRIEIRSRSCERWGCNSNDHENRSGRIMCH